MNHKWEKGFDEVRDRQAVKGLSLSPKERLVWLYETLLFVKKYSKKDKIGNQE